MTIANVDNSRFLQVDSWPKSAGLVWALAAT